MVLPDPARKRKMGIRGHPEPRQGAAAPLQSPLQPVLWQLPTVKLEQVPAGRPILVHVCTLPTQANATAKANG